MSANTFGNILTLTSFGESHGPVVGGVIDGLPAGLEVDFSFIKQQLDRRKPQKNEGGTARTEADEVNWLSGIFQGKTTGSPLAFTITNKQHRSSDYDHLKDIYRPSHADFTWERKYGFRDYRGGGRASARETVVRVVAGALVYQLLKLNDISVISAVTQIGGIKAEAELNDISNCKDQLYGFADQSRVKEIEQLMKKLREQGDTAGGVVGCRITGVPAGLGEPVYHKLHADLAAAMMSINSVKGFEYGEGFAAADMFGSEHNDAFISKDTNIITQTNHSGGIQGGISNGEDILFRLAFKPVASVNQTQDTVNSEGKPVKLKIYGRHDVCVVPRALPIVESMATLVIADHLLWSKSSRIS